MKLETKARAGHVGNIKEFGSVLRVMENYCRDSRGEAAIRSAFRSALQLRGDGLVAQIRETRVKRVKWVKSAGTLSIGLGTI